MKDTLNKKIESELAKMNIKIDLYNRWNGNYKSLTKDCETCSSHNIVYGKDICVVGKAWKYLDKGKKLRKCQYVSG